MSNIILLKRKNLGIVTCKAIRKYSRYPVTIIKNWKQEIPENVDILIRHGCLTKASARFTYNNTEAIQFCSNKGESRKYLSEYHKEEYPQLFPLVPNTMISDDFDNPAQWYNEWEYNWPVIIRPVYHHSGKQLLFIRNKQEARNTRIPFSDFYVSEFINKVSEYRFYIVNNRLVHIAEKVPQDKTAIAWNRVQGSDFVNIPINIFLDQTILENEEYTFLYFLAIKKAILASYLAKIDICGVDVMFDAEGNSYILELNSGASLTEITRQKIVTKAIDWTITETLRNNRKVYLPEPNYNSDNINDFLHPIL